MLPISAHKATPNEKFFKINVRLAPIIHLEDTGNVLQRTSGLERCDRGLPDSFNGNVPNVAAVLSKRR